MRENRNQNSSVLRFIWLFLRLIKEVFMKCYSRIKFVYFVFSLNWSLLRVTILYFYKFLLRGYLTLSSRLTSPTTFLSDFLFSIFFNFSTILALIKLLINSWSFFLLNSLSRSFLVNFGVLFYLPLDIEFATGYDFWVFTRLNTVFWFFSTVLRLGDGLFSNFSNNFLRFSLFLDC